MEWNWILEEYDDMVYVSDLNNYELLYVNRAGLDMFHLSREELFSGKKHLCYEIFHGRNTPCPFCTNNYLKDSGFYEWEHYNEQLGKTYLLKDRKVLWDGRESRIEFVFDVSKYKNKLDKQGKQQAAMLRSLPGGIARLDARDERTILWYGSEFLSIIGYTEEQFKEELQSQCLYVHPEDLEQAEAAMHEAKETGRSSIMQGRIVTRSGKIRHLTITFSYMDGKDSEDGIPSYYSLGIDVTETVERQRLQQQALEDACRVAKHANQGKTEFLSRMSHDIRTPMNAIVGMTAIAGMNVGNPERLSECLNNIALSSRFLLSLINDVLDVAKIESGKMSLASEPFDFDELVSSVSSFTYGSAVAKGIIFNLFASPLLEKIYVGDPLRIKQVLMNLLSNALKFAPEKGRIEFNITPVQKVGHRELVRFVISDNGIGMSKSFQERMFQPFEQEMTDQRGLSGSGLGLAIVRSFVQLMDGTIRVESEQGKGSSFSVDIPLGLFEGALYGWDKDALEQSESVRVLVIGDDRAACEHTAVLLRRMAVEASFVLSGEEGVVCVRQARERRRDYGMILIDWKKPGMDDMETVRHIREIVGKATTPIAMSACDWRGMEAPARTAGVDYFINKPVLREHLRDMLLVVTHHRHAFDVPAMPEEVRFNREKILIAEDNDLNAEILKTLLESRNLSVVWAENGKVAVGLFAESEPGEYAAILMDVRMPVMDGLEATRHIRGMTREDARRIPIFALSANAFADDIQRSLQCGMNTHFNKPVDMDSICAALHYWLEHDKGNRP